MIFCSKKKKWIEKHTAVIKKNQQQYSNIISTKGILYFGDLFEVKEIRNLKTATLQDNCLYIKECKDFKTREKEIKKWYLKTAKHVLSERLDYFSHLLELDYNEFKLTNAKTKWGSCSILKKIELNWRLIMIESKYQDYVIVHELCHLLEMNHSQNFYKCIECVIKDYKERRKIIKSFAFLLQLYR